MNEREEGCPLCGICEREPENVLYEDEHFAIIRTANLKGHHERVMLILKRHLADIPPHISYDFSWVTKTPVIRQRIKEIFGTLTRQSSWKASMAFIRIIGTSV